ncbi:MAG: hypothetical protein ACI87H_002485, partial [Gammaproteobacteria bacterium]
MFRLHINNLNKYGTDEMNNRRIKTLARILLIITFNLSLIACGGGGGAAAPSEPNAPNAPNAPNLPNAPTAVIVTGSSLQASVSWAASSGADSFNL